MLGQPYFIAGGRGLAHTGAMRNPWKWVALILGAALVVLAIFTILVVNGVMEFGLSVL